MRTGDRSVSAYLMWIAAAATEGSGQQEHEAEGAQLYSFRT